jgi:pseudouridine kinase
MSWGNQAGRRVVCAGGAVIDVKFRLDAAAVPGTSNPGSVTTSFGGVARNVAENLAGLLIGSGAGVELVSAIGDDAAADGLLEQLRGCGVGVRNVAVVAGEPTAQYVAVLEPDGGLVIGAAGMRVLERIGIPALAAAWPDAGWLFCDGNLSAEVLAHVLARARRTGLPVAVDAVSTAKVTRLPADLRGLALLSCNRDEAQAWLAHHHLEPAGEDAELARRLHAAGAAAVLLTLGADGLILVQEGQAERIPAVPAEPVDVTGAGDALIAGTLAALLRGADLSQAARAGAERAARTVESELSVLPAAK